MTLDVGLRYPINALVSYYHFRNKDVIALAKGGLRLIADSGAFSAYTLGATINLDDFTAWLDQNKGFLCWAASVDVIGNPNATKNNFKVLTKAGYDVVPTVHFGTSPKELDFYASQGVDFIGLGGLVKKSKTLAHRWLVQIMSYAQKHHPQIRFHAWGVTSTQFLRHFPFWSCDSSSFASATRYGSIRFFNPNAGSWVAIKGREADLHKHHLLLKNYYNIQPKQIVETRKDYKNLNLLAAKAYQLCEAYLNNRRSLTPPNYGQLLPTKHIGVHVVDVNYQFLKNITIASNEGTVF
jgi:hypothetical protein